MRIASLSPDKQRKAIQLYASGLSAQQIADYFGVKIDAVYYPLRRYNIPRRTPQESNRIRFEAKPLSYRVKERLTEEERDLKLAAVMLYWAEGYKVGKGTVDFANSDPDMVILFMRFLREVCGVAESRLRLHLYCYEGQDVPYLKGFWSRLLNVPEEQFIKPYIKEAAPGPRGPRMHHGLVHLRYSDRKLLRQILCWIDEYRRKSVGGGVVNRDWL